MNILAVTFGKTQGYSIQNGIKRKIIMDDTTIQITFTKDDIAYLREKFDIEDKEDLYEAVWEMIGTYMEI